jgi:hypothetical protein
VTQGKAVSDKLRINDQLPERGCGFLKPSLAVSDNGQFAVTWEMIGNLIFRLYRKKEENTLKRVSENFRISSYNSNFSDKICP